MGTQKKGCLAPSVESKKHLRPEGKSRLAMTERVAGKKSSRIRDEGASLVTAHQHRHPILPESAKYEIADIEYVHHMVSPAARRIRICLTKAGKVKTLQFSAVQGLDLLDELPPHHGPSIYDVSSSGMEGVSVYVELADDGFRLSFYAGSAEVV